MRSLTHVSGQTRISCTPGKSHPASCQWVCVAVTRKMLKPAQPHRLVQPGWTALSGMQQAFAAFQAHWPPARHQTGRGSVAVDRDLPAGINKCRIDLNARYDVIQMALSVAYQ